MKLKNIALLFSIYITVQHSDKTWYFCLGYNSNESFNDKSMTNHLHNYCFQSEPQRVKDVQLSESRVEDLMPAIDKLLGKYSTCHKNFQDILIW